MNISSMNTLLISNYTENKHTGSSFMLRLNQNKGLKSTQQQMERLQKTASQVNFYEQQKDGLKNVHCDTVEQIADKLDQFHRYEEQIDAAKKSYNYEQMFHVQDEAKETGEKIAEAAGKYKPKTAKERAEEAREEALGTEDEGMLSEILDEIEEAVEQVQEELPERMPADELEPMPSEILSEQMAEELQEQNKYQPLDIRI